MIPDDIPELPEHWKKLREPLAAGDRPEAIKRLRLFVDHEPFALAPRHALASLLVDAAQGAAALIQFEKLLTAAVTRGDLFRAIAVQRRIDEMAGRPLEPATYAALHRWFRLAGERNLLPSVVGAESGLTPVRLLRLPAEQFVWVAVRSRLHRLDTGWHIEPIAGACQWNLMWGALRWEVGQPGPRPRQRHVAEGESLLAIPAAGDRAPLRVAADLPSEALVFENAVLRQLATQDPRVLAGAADDIVHEDRGRIAPPPGALGDLDVRARVPRAPEAEAPRTLRIEPPAAGVSASADARDWLEPGLLSPGDGGDGANAAPPGPIAEIPGLERGTSSVTRGPAEPAPPVTSQPRPRGTFGELELPPAPVGTPVGPPSRTPDDPAEFGTIRFDAPVEMPSADSPASEEARALRRERRGGDRTPTRYRGRVRLLGMGHAGGVEMDCQLVDLSATGVRIELAADAVLPLVRMLEGETLRIELAPGAGNLELAGRVRWLDIDADGPIQAGIEFVLVTSADAAAIADLIARARHEETPTGPVPGDADRSDGAAA